MSLALRLALGFVMVLAATLMLLLASASSSSSVFDQIYPWLLGANVMITLIMAGLTIWVIVRFWQRFQRGVFGARIMVRLAFAFALIGIIPVVLVSFVSAQFLAKTIDSWSFSKGKTILHQLELGSLGYDSPLIFQLGKK